MSWLSFSRYSQCQMPFGDNRAKTYEWSSFSISAWEYAAPTTRLDSRVGFLGPFTGPFADVGLRQNGEAELLEGQQHRLARHKLRGNTYSDLSI